MSGVVVLNSHGAFLVDASGNVISRADGAAIASAEAVLVAGQDGTTTRFLRTANDGTLRIDPTGSTVQPVSASSLPLPIGAATSANQTTLINHVDGLETLLATIQSVLEAIRDTAGIKKITDALPSGSNDVGSFRLRDILGNGINSILNNAIRRLEARSSLTSADGALDVAVITDNSINRVESRSSLVGQIAGSGGEVKVTTIEDTQTATHKRLQTEARIAPGSTINIGTGVPSDPSDLVVVRLLRSGSANMLVNASLGTPFDFSYAPIAGQIISLEQLRIVFVANSFDYGEDDFGPNNALTNGIQIQIQISTVLTTLVTVNNNEDFLMIPGEVPVIHADVHDLIMANLSFGGAVKLNGDTGDFIRMRIRDNLTAAQFRYLQASVLALKA